MNIKGLKRTKNGRHNRKNYKRCTDRMEKNKSVSTSVNKGAKVNEKHNKCWMSHMKPNQTRATG